MKVIQYSGGFANGFFIKNGETVIAVDTGCEEGKEYYLAHCNECGINPKSIKLLVLTHGHSDHYFNTEAVRELSGAPSLIHELDAHFMEKGEMPDVDICGRTKLGYQILAKQKEEGKGPVEFAPIATIDIKWNGKRYDLNQWGVDGNIYLTPGHTKGSCSILLADGSAIVGDTFAQFCDETGGGPAFLRYVESPYEEIQEDLKMLLDLGAKIFYSGHGGPYSREFVEEKLNDEIQGKEVGEDYIK